MTWQLSIHESKSAKDDLLTPQLETSKDFSKISFTYLCVTDAKFHWN